MKKVLIVLAVIIVVLAVIIQMQPSEFRVSRSATINAPAATVFDQVNISKNWENWSPWAKLDPNAKFTYEGPVHGVGSVSKWEGDHNVGVGSSTIVESTPAEHIKFRLDFLKPMKSTNTVEFFFTTPNPTETVVTWTMYGHCNFVCKAMGLIFNCKKMVGEQFDQGLANLKTVSEAPASTPAATPAK